MNKTVDIADIAIATTLFPINIVVKARSNLSQIFIITFAVLFPSSASTWILKRLQQEKAVSLQEKKKLNIIQIQITSHDIGSGIKPPLPIRTKEFSDKYIIICIFFQRH